jgi:hypothetical protein
VALHLAARLHAFTHGLFRPSDATQTRELYGRVAHLFKQHSVADSEARDELIDAIADAVLADLEISGDLDQSATVFYLTRQLFDYEGLFLLPAIDWSERRSVTQYWEIRNYLNVQRRLLENFDETRWRLRENLAGFVAPLLEAWPSPPAEDGETDGITVPTELLRSLGNVGAITEAMMDVVLREKASEDDILPRLRDRLECNVVAASGGNPADKHGFNRAPKLPTQFDAKNSALLVATYLGGTPLTTLFEQDLSFTIPTAARFEHHHIVAGSGHGKTQTLQYLIGQDLEAVAVGRRTVIVLDSQGDLIRNIANLAEFAPDGPLHDRIVIIDPTDVEWPVSLNLFDVGIERLQGYKLLERERLTNSILELYDFVLGTLLSAEMTQKQNVIFRYVTRLMLHIPGATIHTLRELMEPGSEVRFAEHIVKLSGTARHFFETEFSSKEFEQTKKQVLRRLWGILENQTFERMFSHPQSKLDLFAEMNAGKVILINTAKDLLKEQGTEIFGRFFIAMIAQAAQERATLPSNRRLPTIVYIDEAADYFDRNIGIILAQARKYNVGMVLAHQYLGQLDPKLQEAFAANTAIKFAGGVSAKDARTLGPMLYCDPAFIEAQPKGHFAAHVRGLTKTAVPLAFPFGALERRPTMTPGERAVLQDRMRERYAVHYSMLGQVPAAEELVVEPEAATAAPPPPSTAPGQINTDAGEQW